MRLATEVRDITCHIRTFCEMVMFSSPDLFDERGHPLPGETSVWMGRINGWIERLDKAVCKEEAKHEAERERWTLPTE